MLPNIITILGARPQFIKAAALSHHLKDVVHEDILHTGQHYDHLMSGAFFDQLELKQPTWHLDCSEPTTERSTIARMLDGIEKILAERKPRAVLVYGDTNSTLAGALAAVRLQIPVWHIESGVRSYNKKMLEEINRIVTDRVADVHFAPSPTACRNLVKEGISAASIYEVGDLMYDLYKISVTKAKAVQLPVVGDFLLLTLHRAENFQKTEDVEILFDGLNKIAEKYPIILPVHPRVKKIIQQKNLLISQNIFMHEPFDYFEMLYVLNKCKAVMTDSGGLQKEAFYASKPCVTIRDETEWVELVESGWVMLVKAMQLSEKKSQILKFLAEDHVNKSKDNFYGTGDTGHKIKEIIREIA